MKCLKCGKETKNPKFCSKSCSVSYTNSLRKITKKCKVCGKELYRHNTTGFCQKHFNQSQTEIRKNEYISEWLKTGNLPTKSSPRGTVRSFIMKEQNNKCIICGVENEWNGNKLVFILDHINGNNKQNNRENLRMICPNCDSQLDTFKSKNKGNGRKYDKEYRKKYYHLNK